jgi:hypothetical protein
LLALSGLSIPLQAAQSQSFAKWKTFSNRAGWSVRYPASWKISSCMNCPDPTAPDVFVDFFSPKFGDHFGLVMIQHLASKPARMSVDAWFADVKQTADQNPIIEEHRFSLNHLPALKVRYRNPSYGGSEIDTVYVLAGSQTFEISFSGDKPDQRLVEKLKNYPTYLKMVESFKFNH